MEPAAAPASPALPHGGHAAAGGTVRRRQYAALGLTFAAYAAFHASRKPPSIVKAVLSAGWVPFTGPEGTHHLGELDVAFLAAYAAAMFAAGHLADRADLRVLLGAAMLASGAASAALGAAYFLGVHSLTFFLAAQVASGVVQAAGWPCVVAVVGNWFGHASRRGTIMGVWNSHTSVGNIAGSVLAAAVLEFGWGWSFLVPAFVIAALGVVVLVFLVAHPGDAGLELDAMEVEMSGDGGEEVELLVEDKKEAEVDDDGELELEMGSQLPRAIGFLEAWRLPGVAEYAFCLFFSKLVAYTFLYWLPFYIRILMDEIHQLTADLCILYNFMLNLSDVLQDPPMAARYWMKDVRELSYDMNDFADQFVHAHGSAKIPRANHRKNKTISRVKIVRLSKRSKWQPGITDKVSEFRTRAQEAIRRYRRYKFDDCAFNPGCSHIGRGRPTILPHPDDLVGIEGPSNELEWWLIDGEEQLKVVSIVGVAGVGKTTLALRLWGKLRGQFECGAFVRIAQKPDMRGILRNILLQVRPNQPPRHGEMRHLINDLREYLQDKRYFVIIDDLWVTSVWDVVSRAFPKSGFSRIITTAEIMEVALACCGFCPEHIYKMESLNDNDSEKLLLQRIRVSGNQSPLQFDDAIPQIIRSCGGFPLAIIIVARILASQPEKLEHWGRAQNSFDSIFGSNPTKEGFMGQILDICFNSLPHYLKTCLLYLSTYPEGYLFLKDDLVKQWVAECFVCANEGEDMEEVAGSYFDELVSMGLIQVMDIYCDYELLSYSVHQLVLDLITYKSIEENFITVVDYSQTTTSLPDKVRRLALHFGSAAYASTPESTGLSQVRSLFFSGLFNCIPSFMVFKLLRVLILHFWDDTGTKTLNLTVICELLWLRYLQVTCNAIVKLPDKIETMKHLETLEINARVLDVPPDIVRLSSLLHLCLRGSNLPNGIRCIRSLRTLMYFDLGSSCEDNLCGLGELTNLRDLHLTYSSSPSSEHLKRNLIALASSLGKLCNLKSLTLDAGIAGTAGTVVLSDGSSGIRAPIFLEKLKLLPPIFIFSRLPKWIGQLRKICIMKAAVRELPLSDIAILAGLPSLTVLSLSVQMAPEGRIVFNNRAFPVLKYFKFRCGVLCMSFMAGAMPNLHRLKLGFNAHIGEKYDNMIAGIEHLLYLQNITGQIGATSVSEWRAAESAINDAINKHPRFPRRNLQWVDPVEEECNPSVKHHWSQGKSSLGEKHGVLDKANDMNEHVDMGLSQLPNLPSTVASGRLKSGIVEALEESNQSPDPSFPSSLRRVHWLSAKEKKTMQAGSSASSIILDQYRYAHGLILQILGAAVTARQHRLECDNLTQCLHEINALFPGLQLEDSEMALQLARLIGTLQEARDLVVACQSWKFFFARGVDAERFRGVKRRILDFHMFVNWAKETAKSSSSKEDVTPKTPLLRSSSKEDAMPEAPLLPFFTWASISRHGPR